MTYNLLECLQLCQTLCLLRWFSVWSIRKNHSERPDKYGRWGTALILCFARNSLILNARLSFPATSRYLGHVTSKTVLLWTVYEIEFQFHFSRNCPQKLKQGMYNCTNWLKILKSMTSTKFLIIYLGGSSLLSWNIFLLFSFCATFLIWSTCTMSYVYSCNCIRVIIPIIFWYWY